MNTGEEMHIRIGSRPSRLAMLQVQEIMDRLPGVGYKIIVVETEGDRDKTTPLSGREAADFFTYDIEKALLGGEIDAAVHSAKDLEEAPPAGLVIAAMTGSISPPECLVSRNNLGLKELPPGAIVGTSSRKRKAALAGIRKDLIMKDIRGNVDERISQLDRGVFDAIIVAHAALLRLGYEDRVTEIIPPHVIEPHPLQGRLAVQVRGDRADLIELFGDIHAK